MGFAAIARVTEDQWVTCSVKDSISFGLKPGDELKVETTICHEVRQKNEAILIDDVQKDPQYFDHHTPVIYGIQSYISVPIYRKDGSFFGTLCAIDPKPARIKTPEILGMFKLFADLIAFHLQALDEKNLVIEELKEEKQTAVLREEFIAILGHDLRNPLATTRMSAEILLKVAKDEMTKRQAGIIKSTSFRMEKLIENMLDFARGRLGEGILISPKTDNPSLLKTLEQIIKELQTNSPERELSVNLVLEQPVHCDKNRVGQLFSNLLSNAFSHGDEDTPIFVEAGTRDGIFSLSVTNSGDEIPETALKNLFQPFYRQDHKPGKQGLGLGLYIASEIAKAHNGTLKVSSSKKEINFTFEMPLS